MTQKAIDDFLSNDPDSPEEENLFTNLCIYYSKGNKVGSGIIRILKNVQKDDINYGRCRILMRKNKEYNALINHFVLPHSEEPKVIEEKKSFLYRAVNYANPENPSDELITVVFLDKEILLDFNNKYKEALKINTDLLKPSAPKSSNFTTNISSPKPENQAATSTQNSQSNPWLKSGNQTGTPTQNSQSNPWLKPGNQTGTPAQNSQSNPWLKPGNQTAASTPSSKPNPWAKVGGDQAGTTQQNTTQNYGNWNTGNWNTGKIKFGGGATVWNPKK